MGLIASYILFTETWTMSSFTARSIWSAGVLVVSGMVSLIFVSACVQSVTAISRRLFAQTPVKSVGKPAEVIQLFPEESVFPLRRSA